MQELERKQDGQRDAVAQKGVQENQAELFRDPDSPTGGATLLSLPWQLACAPPRARLTGVGSAPDARRDGDERAEHGEAET